MSEPDGYAVVMKAKDAPRGYRFVMAYTDRATAELLVSKEAERGINKGLSVKPFKFVEE